MLGGKFTVQLFLLVACANTFVDSKPALGENEKSVSENNPPKVSEAGKTTYSIGNKDVLTPNENAYLKAETQSRGTFYLLKKDSNHTDLSENYLSEIAKNQKCAKEMETFDRCMKNRKNGGSEKVSINTLRVSKADGETYPVDADCFNNQIDLEQCVINNNRYYPCAPPPSDSSHYKNLYVERSLQLSEIIKSAGFVLSESIQTLDFGSVTVYEIVNYNETYENYVNNFKKNLERNDLPEPYESFKNNFLKVQSVASTKSINYNKFKNAFRAEICRKEVLNLDESIATVTSTETKFKKPEPELKAAFEKFNSSLKGLLGKFPTQVQEQCVNVEQHQAHVTNKIKILELLNLNC